MQNEHLPTEELKKFGIINEDLSFSKKLNANDIQKFLQGYTIVADNDKNRATFQLVENNTKLKVIFLERDKSLSEILEKSKERIQYSETKVQYDVNENKHSAQLSFSKQAFVFDKDTNTVKELDFIKNAVELTKLVVGRKSPNEISQYQLELEKLKSFLYDKMDQYPEIAKAIAGDLNIVDKEISSISSISNTDWQVENDHRREVRFDVNDSDRYEDANRKREEEQEEELHRPRGRGR
ncbi:hypothetical protein [Chryseobacterium shigense]|uniref:Uncharacterized protein n=1 Tax=Chryseobacterium shigense TaxID=297244 RepID=A0A841N9G9_9FLAO|nr:hypothetical protein [Chryseobacterium shigense]MBB6370040.1 hypothetical protein [Chryseobacterium shigense]